MNEQRLSTIVGLCLIFSHILTYAYLLVLTATDHYTVTELMQLCAVLTPLFAAYTTVAIKWFMLRKIDDDRGAKVPGAVAALSLAIPVAYVVVMVTIVSWKAFGALGFSDSVTIVGSAEVVFGLYVGAIVTRFFPVSESSE